MCNSTPPSPPGRSVLREPRVPLHSPLEKDQTGLGIAKLLLKDSLSHRPVQHIGRTQSFKLYVQVEHGGNRSGVAKAFLQAQTELCLVEGELKGTESSSREFYFQPVL